LEQTQPEQNGRLGSSFKLVGTPKILEVFAKLWFSVLDGDFQRFLYEATATFRAICSKQANFVEIWQRMVRLGMGEFLT
jgi:hypothetical protein